MFSEEGRNTTLWLVIGNTLFKAKASQVRKVTRTEQLKATLEGMTTHNTPVNPSTLLRALKGRDYRDVTGETPSASQQDEADLLIPHVDSGTQEAAKDATLFSSSGWNYSRDQRTCRDTSHW